MRALRANDVRRVQGVVNAVILYVEVLSITQFQKQGSWMRFKPDIADVVYFTRYVWAKAVTYT